VSFQAGRMILTNFALREERNAAYDEQQIHLLSIVVFVDHHGVWLMAFNDNKNR
jgi:hypothetical protein